MQDMEPVCFVCLSKSVTLVNLFTESQVSAKEPQLVEIINECFHFKVNADNKHLKNLCECCVSDVRAAYRFKRNYEYNIKMKENEIDDFIDSLAAENWELISNVVKKEQEDISDGECTKENKLQTETATTLRRAKTEDEVATELGKTVKKKKTHTCIFCGKVFIRKPHLRIHLRVHTGERPYNCPHCKKSFTQTSSLKLHLRVHTGEREFKCPHCPKDFTRKHNLMNHVAKHTSRNDPKTKLRQKKTSKE